MEKLADFLALFGLDTSPILGLDIGASGVKIMALEKSGEKIKLQNYAIIPLEPGVVVEKNILEPEAVTAAIAKAVEKSAIEVKKVCTSLASSASITRTVQLGKELSDKDLGGEIELGADRYIPFPLHEVNFDYTIMGDSANTKDLVDVLIVATKSENVERLRNITLEAGLKIDIIDVDTYSLTRAFKLVAKQLPEHGKGKVIALFDVGATTTTFLIIKDEKILYTREQSFGSQQLVDEVQNIYGLNYDEAITAMTFEDLPKDYESDILDPFKQTIAQQVNRFCQFFYSAGDYTSVDYIFLTGGCFSLLGLDVAVQSKMGIKTFIADPFSTIELSDTINQEEFRTDRERLMNCLGLALRNFDHEKY